MRLLITADLHYNHPRSKAPADDLIDRMNRAGGDLLIIVGDTAVADGNDLENCLSRFNFAGPKLFVAGNHELWTRGPDSYGIYTQDLPRRVRELGWHWLEDEPFVAGDLAVVGSIGWYDYSFAAESLGIPRRFYQAKVSPGAARRLSQFAPLFDRTDDIPANAEEVVARWNDGKFIKLGRDDDAFVGQLLIRLTAQLESLRASERIIACIHHLPFRELLPPPHSSQWDFAKAFLGSERFGQVISSYDNVTDLYCGHSHLPMRARIGKINAINIGSGYRIKTFETLEVTEHKGN
jgi:predicted phosphodiesterase